MSRVVIYSRDWCGYCTAAKMFLKAKGIDFEEIDLTDDDAGSAALTERTGRTAVPQIFIGDTHVGGWDELRALDRAGKLQPLLAD